jgi:hypothetical protein
MASRQVTPSAPRAASFSRPSNDLSSSPGVTPDCNFQAYLLRDESGFTGTQTGTSAPPGRSITLVTAVPAVCAVT